MVSFDGGELDIVSGSFCLNLIYLRYLQKPFNFVKETPQNGVQLGEIVNVGEVKALQLQNVFFVMF
jgi:hypothetical protein